MKNKMEWYVECWGQSGNSQGFRTKADAMEYFRKVKKSIRQSTPGETWRTSKSDGEESFICSDDCSQIILRRY